jgi:hypothetical protein
VDEAPVLAGDVDDERLAGVGLRADGEGRHIYALLAQHVGDGPAEDVAADAADDRGRHAHARQIDGDVGRTAADGQEEAVRQHQLAGGRQVADGGADVVGDDDAGAQDVGVLAHAGPRVWRL